MADHAKLSPSAASRWLECPLSVLLPQKEDSGSVYAAEGTLAHEVCAALLTTGAVTPAADEEMLTCGEYYAHLVLDCLAEARRSDAGARLYVEQRLDMTARVPGCFGTADAIVARAGRIDVFDYKYGRGVRVNAYGNPQMRLYALGALDHLGSEYDARTIVTHIVQPRLDHISEERISAAALEAWCEGVVYPAARAIETETGTARAGAWCRWCRVERCRAWAVWAMMQARTGREPQLSADEVGLSVLPHLEAIRDWCNRVEAEALEAALHGEAPRGWKVVHGRGRRVIMDPESTKNALMAAGYAEETICKPGMLRSLTALEKSVGRQRLADLCGKYVEKVEGAPKLAPADDSRREWSDVSDLMEID